MLFVSLVVSRLPIVYLFFQSVELQTSIWSPLAFQGWKPCTERPKPPCEFKLYIEFNFLLHIGHLFLMKTRALLSVGSVWYFTCFFLLIISCSTTWKVMGLYPGFPWWRVEPAEDRGKWMNEIVLKGYNLIEEVKWKKNVVFYHLSHWHLPQKSKLDRLSNTVLPLFSL